MQKLAKQAKIAEDNLAIKRFNAAEEERLQDLLRLQVRCASMEKDMGA
jgi:hypothetical protein